MIDETRRVFPTPVGVFLQNSLARYLHASLPHARGGVFIAMAGELAAKCLPHARGGVSSLVYEANVDVMSSPRPWGCFPDGFCGSGHFRVFPTPVGVFLR